MARLYLQSRAFVEGELVGPGWVDWPEGAPAPSTAKTEAPRQKPKPKKKEAETLSEATPKGPDI